MLPQNLESNKMDIEIYLLLNDSEVKYTTPITPSTNGQLEGGKKYTYNITVKNTGITIENANIVPWGNGDSSDFSNETPIATERRSTTVRLPSGTTRKAKRNATKKLRKPYGSGVFLLLMSYWISPRSSLRA